MPTNLTWHLPWRFGCFSSQQWLFEGFLDSTPTRSPVTSDGRLAVLPCTPHRYLSFWRRAMFDNWTCGHHTSPHSHPTLGDHYIIGGLNSSKPQGVWIIMNLSHLIKQSKRNNTSDTIHLSAVTACHYYIWLQFLPPTSHPYRSLTTFQHLTYSGTLRCLHQVLEDGCVQPVSTDGIMEKG